MPNEKTVIILSASSDIGNALVERYIKAGYNVVGTYRNKGALKKFDHEENTFFFKVDLNFADDIHEFHENYSRLDLPWDLLIAANGTMEPIGPFMNIDFEQWHQSISANALMPCRFLKAIYPLRKTSITPGVCFMAGGGTNNPFRNYSAYCLSKIILIKMCELLADEVPDLKSFIIGPGYIKTKIHRETLRADKLAGENLKKTKHFLLEKGTSLDEVFDCIQWCNSQPMEVISGRNVSVVHDPWKSKGAPLGKWLLKDQNYFKLRRAGNDFDFLTRE